MIVDSKNIVFLYTKHCRQYSFVDTTNSAFHFPYQFNKFAIAGHRRFYFYRNLENLSCCMQTEVAVSPLLVASSNFVFIFIFIGIETRSW